MEYLGRLLSWNIFDEGVCCVISERGRCQGISGVVIVEYLRSIVVEHLEWGVVVEYLGMLF